MYEWLENVFSYFNLDEAGIWLESRLGRAVTVAERKTLDEDAKIVFADFTGLKKVDIWYICSTDASQLLREVLRAYGYKPLSINKVELITTTSHKPERSSYFLGEKNQLYVKYRSGSLVRVTEENPPPLKFVKILMGYSSFTGGMYDDVVKFLKKRRLLDEKVRYIVVGFDLKIIAFGLNRFCRVLQTFKMPGYAAKMVLAEVKPEDNLYDAIAPAFCTVIVADDYELHMAPSPWIVVISGLSHIGDPLVELLVGSVERAARYGSYGFEAGMSYQELCDSWAAGLARYVKPSENYLMAAIFTENDPVRLTAIKMIYRVLYRKE